MDLLDALITAGMVVGITFYAIGVGIYETGLAF